MTNNNLSLISVVTVTYNAASVLEDTILSVINQTYSNIEYIIIDGGSTDGTVDIIKRYQDKITYWVSEADGGIYDAMNKGANRAVGEWINFMNAGDSFCDNRVLADIVDFLFEKESNVSVIYGNTILKYPSGLSNVKAKPLSVINKKMPFYHQSSFVKSCFLKERLFNLAYKFAADYDLFYNFFKQNNNFLYIDRDISVYDYSDGLSIKNEKQVIEEYIQIQKGKKTLFFHIKYFIRCIILFIKSFLPNKVVYILRRR